MIANHTLRAALLGCALLLGGGTALAESVAAPAAPAAIGYRDGQHDFDFKLGVWKTEIHRVLHPFSNSSDTIDLSGTITVRPVWQGRAFLEEIEADGSQGHWEAATFFLYDPRARQWNQNYVNARNGSFNGANPMIGEFQDGRGDFYAQDTLDGRSILVRGTWSEITADSHRYEEAYSADGGRTWKTAFAAKLKKVAK
jgi:hypothetical protein